MPLFRQGLTALDAPCLMIALTSLFACHKGGEARPDADGKSQGFAVRCVPAVMSSIQEHHLLRGTVVPRLNHDATVASQIAGRLIDVTVHEGQWVNKGQVVAHVEAEPAKDALTQVQAGRELASAAAQNANLTYERAQHLFARGLIPHQQVDDDHTRVLSTEAALRSADAAVDAAARQLDRTFVRSPLAGVVVRVMRRSGELVDGTYGTAIAEVADTREVDFLASAPPDDLVALKEGDTGFARFDVLPGKTYPLTVSIVAPSVDPLSGVGTVRLQMAPEGPAPSLGLFGTATVAARGAHEGLTVPLEALRHASDGSMELVLCQQGRARVAPVAVGARLNGQAEILSGLKVGDAVVVDNVVGLVEGQALRQVQP